MTPTNLYLDSQGRSITTTLIGGELLSDKHHCGIVLDGKESTLPTKNLWVSLNLSQQKILSVRDYISAILRYQYLLFQDVKWDENLFSHLRNNGYTLIVVPYTQEWWDRSICMVTAIRDVDSSAVGVDILPLYQHDGKVAQFHRAYCDRDANTERVSNEKAFTQICVLTRLKTGITLGNVYFPCTIWHDDRAKNIEFLCHNMWRNSIIAGDLNIYGNLVDTWSVMQTPRFVRKIFQKLPNSIAQPLWVHTDGSVAPYPLGILANILSGSDKKERDLLVWIARKHDKYLTFPDGPTIRKWPISMTLDGILSSDPVKVESRTMTPSLSDHNPMFITQV